MCLAVLLEMIFAANDVRGVHLQIVNDVHEMEHGALAVRTQDDKVGINFFAVGEFADDIADDEGRGW